MPIPKLGLYSLLFFTCLINQALFGKLSSLPAELSSINAEYVQFDAEREAPSFLLFDACNRPGLANYYASEASVFALASTTTFQEVFAKTRENGVQHHRRQQLYKGIPVKGKFITVHSIEGQVSAVNADLAPDISLSIHPQVSAEDARSIALGALGIDYTTWKHLKFAYNELLNNEAALQVEYDQLELQILWQEKTPLLVWEYKMTSTFLGKQGTLLINAQDGQLITKDNGQLNWQAKNQLMANLPWYVQDHNLDDFSFFGGGGATFLFNLTRRIRSLDSNGSLVTTSAGSWNQSEANAFFSLQETQDAYNGLFSRSSIDADWINLRPSTGNIATQSTEYINPNNSGGNFHLIQYAIGTTGMSDDQNSLDIIGHEFTHGITESVGWVKQNNDSESDGLIEGYCDIMGQIVEWYFENQTFGAPYPDANSPDADWTTGDDVLNAVIRNFRDPSLDMVYAIIDPPSICCDDSTPGGDMSCCNDVFYDMVPKPSAASYCVGNFANLGEHQKGGVLRHWFYLLSAGGSGTNDCGDAYEVCGDGVLNAAELVYEIVDGGYLSSNPSFTDFANASMLAAATLSVHDNKVQDAWYAVGVLPEPGYNINHISASVDDNSVDQGQTFTLSAAMAGINVDVDQTMCYALSTDMSLSTDDYDFGGLTTPLSFDCDYSLVEHFQQNLVIPTSIAPGNYFLIVTAGCGTLGNETNTGDNVQIIPIQVLAPGTGIDLTVTSVTPPYNTSSPSLTHGQVLSSSGTVLNQGNLPTGPFWFRMYIRPLNTLTVPIQSVTVSQMGPPVGTRYISNLNSNATYTANFFTTIPSSWPVGAYVIFYVADPENSITETDETNNIQYGGFFVRTLGGGGDGPGKPDDCRLPPCPLPTTGEDNTGQMAFTVFPNPVGQDNAFTINYTPSTASNLLISVTDLHGRLLQRFDLLPQEQSGRLRANLGQGAPGLYIVTLERDGQMTHQKLMVQ